MEGLVIWVVGSRGMLGSTLVRKIEAEGLPCTGTDREVDITDPAALKEYAAGIFSGGADRGGDWIINCAAYTAVDKAEDEPEAAAALNAAGAGNLAAAAVGSGAGFIHISTDYVFDGRGKTPYKETDRVCPSGVYGKTKLEGEELVLQAFSRHNGGADAKGLPWYIIRTAWLYGPRGKNFVYTMVDLMNSRPEIKVVNDQWGTPTFSVDLARYIVMLLSSGAESGVYHYSGEGETTWFDFACEIYRIGRGKGLITNECRVSPCATEEYPVKAVRPAYSVLSKAKLKRALGVPLPDWKESLLAFMSGPDFKNRPDCGK